MLCLNLIVSLRGQMGSPGHGYCSDSGWDRASWAGAGLSLAPGPLAPGGRTMLSLSSRRGDSPSSSPGPNLASVLPSADVTSRGGEPGWRKEPPSGFREPDLSPGETDTERLTQKPRRCHHTTITIDRATLNPETCNEGRGDCAEHFGSRGRDPGRSIPGR